MSQEFSKYFKILLLVSIGLVWLAQTARSEEPRVFELTLENGAIAVPGSVIRVDKDAAVEVYFTSDANAELHLHGYDLTIHVRADRVTRARLPSNVAGRFPITMHTDGSYPTRGIKHTVLFYYEVYPR